MIPELGEFLDKQILVESKISRKPAGMIKKLYENARRSNMKKPKEPEAQEEFKTKHKQKHNKRNKK